MLGGDAAAVERLAARLEALRPGPSAVPKLAEPVAFTADAEYLAQVARVQDYIRAGDVYQVNLSRRLDVAGTAPESAAALFRALHERAPAPFAALVETPATQHRVELAGAIPARGGRARSRPVRSRGRGRAGAKPPRDRALAAELERSAKDRAEHIMIVDLERNDLGRICRTGSVQVRELARRIALPTVHHLVSSITARCARRCLARAAARDVPGRLDHRRPEAARDGDHRGARARAARRLHGCDRLLRRGRRHRPLDRDPQRGAAGGLLSLHVGGGIVADSDPEAELAETWDKARAFRALCAGGAP